MGDRHPTAQAMVELAMEALDEGGEAAVKVDAIVRQCQVSVTSLYHHFGSREGLIEAALIERYSRIVLTNVDDFVSGVKQSSSRDDMKSLIGRFVPFVQGRPNRDVRFARAAAVGAAISRPALRDHMGRVQETQAHVLADALEDGQRRGIVCTGVDAMSLAFWLSGIVFGKILLEITSPSDDQEKIYSDLTVQAVESVLLPRL
ncbi:MAG: TetR/AcrR family transcriptional regulator [Actinomycetota bacterium]